MTLEFCSSFSSGFFLFFLIFAKVFTDLHSSKWDLLLSLSLMTARRVLEELVWNKRVNLKDITPGSGKILVFGFFLAH